MDLQRAKRPKHKRNRQNQGSTEMKEKKTHWKKLHNPDFIGAYAFQPNEEIIATIKSASVESVTGSGGKSEDCMVVRFNESYIKPLICNVTNSKAISKVAGSEYIEDWQNVAIQLFTTEVNAFGDTVQAVRVRTKAPKLTKPEMNATHEKWEGMIKSLAEGNTSIENILKHYDMSKENQILAAEQVQTLTKTGEVIDNA